ncbi:hypothetical protein Tco_1364091 [Tanacetum coccineum]
MANEGMITHIETDDEGRFKMCFISFGFAIRSFLTHLRPLLITDGAHLKGTYKGTNLVLVGMDGNNQIVPIATDNIQEDMQSIHTRRISKKNFKEEFLPFAALDQKLTKKLEEAGFETWSRAMYPANRYNYMTSNSAELINTLTRHEKGQERN